jgi:hypothetical protein
MAEEATPPEGQEPTPAVTEPAGTEPTGSDSKTFDAEYVSRLRAEAAKHRKEAQEARTKAEEYENRDKSEVEKAQGKATKAERERDEALAKLLRFEVATEKQVPAKLVPLLTATTREELEAQAALILDNAKPADPDFDAGVREPAGPAKSPAQEHDELVTALFGVGPAAVGFTRQSQ